MVVWGEGTNYVGEGGVEKQVIDKEDNRNDDRNKNKRMQIVKLKVIDLCWSLFFLSFIFFLSFFPYSFIYLYIQ